MITTMKPYCRILTCLIVTLVLSGCAAMNGRFSCFYKGKALCKRLDQVNHMVDRGEITAHGYRSPRTVRTLAKRGSSNHHPFGNFSQPFPMQYPAGAPLRYGETVMQAWIAPYVDKHDIYHQQSKIDVVIKPGHWIGDPGSSRKIG